MTNPDLRQSGIHVSASWGFVRYLDGYRWFVNDRDGERHEGQTRTLHGARSVLGKTLKRLGL